MSARWSVRPCQLAWRRWDVRDADGLVVLCSADRVAALDYANKAVRRARIRRLHDTLSGIVAKLAELEVL